MTHADDDGFWNDSPPGKEGGPFIGGQIDAGGHAQSGIENAVAIVKDDKRKTVLTFSGVTLWEPNQKFTVLGKKARAHDISRQPAFEAVFPICHGVLEGRIEPNFVRQVSWHIAMSLYGFAFPGPTRDFILKVQTRRGFDLACVKGRIVFQGQRLRGIPETQRLTAA